MKYDKIKLLGVDFFFIQDTNQKTCVGLFPKISESSSLYHTVPKLVKPCTPMKVAYEAYRLTAYYGQRFRSAVGRSSTKYFVCLQ